MSEDIVSRLFRLARKAKSRGKSDLAFCLAWKANNILALRKLMAEIRS